MRHPGLGVMLMAVPVVAFLIQQAANGKAAEHPIATAALALFAVLLLAGGGALLKRGRR